jgi:hypothetical protein
MIYVGSRIFKHLVKIERAAGFAGMTIFAASAKNSRWPF